MHYLSVCTVFALIVVISANNLQTEDKEITATGALPANGAAVDEVVVESSLHIKPKPKPSTRRFRRAIAGILNSSGIELSSLVEHKRVKRQRKRQPIIPAPEYSQSQAAANAAANNQYQNQNGFGASAANAQAQAFNAGNFGASSAGSVTQALNANKFGVQNAAGASMTQQYILPNGQTINFASTNSFANGGTGNNANSRGGAVSVSGKQ